MSSPKPIYDQKGKVIGFSSSDGTYLNEKGEVKARVRNDTTYDSKNKPVGKGDLGVRFL